MPKKAPIFSSFPQIKMEPILPTSTKIRSPSRMASSWTNTPFFTRTTKPKNLPSWLSDSPQTFSMSWSSTKLKQLHLISRRPQKICQSNSKHTTSTPTDSSKPIKMVSWWLKDMPVAEPCLTTQLLSLLVKSQLSPQASSPSTLPFKWGMTTQNLRSLWWTTDLKEAPLI